MFNYLKFNFTNSGVSCGLYGNVLICRCDIHNFVGTDNISNMKKVFLMALGALAIAGCSQQKKENNVAAADAAPADSAAGHFDVRQLNGCRLHIYITDDQMADASFIIEGTDSIVTLEQPLFKVNAAAFDNYLASLEKPVAKRIADFHLGNTGEDAIVMPAGMPEVVKGPAYSGMMAHFAEEYGDAIEPLPTGPTEEVAFGDTVVYAGVPFVFIKGAANDFPGANIQIGSDAVYSHWAPDSTHVNQLYAADIAGVDARIAELEQILSTGATLFVGGHGFPATADDVKFRIAYLNKVKALKDSNEDAESFVAALIAAYPGLPGEEGVADFAKSLYAE